MPQGDAGAMERFLAGVKADGLQLSAGELATFKNSGTLAKVRESVSGGGRNSQEVLGGGYGERGRHGSG